MSTYKLYKEAKEMASAIVQSDYPHDRMMRVYRKAINRAARRKAAMMAQQDAQAGVWCDGRGIVRVLP